MAVQRAATERAAIFRSSAFSLANICSIGLRSGESGGRWRISAPAASISARTPSTLWLDRLSRMTMSPGLSVGTSTCRTYARKLSPLIAPSKTAGAVSPSARRAPTKVVVFQWPCGTDATSRVPRFDRP